MDYGPRFRPLSAPDIANGFGPGYQKLGKIITIQHPPKSHGLDCRRRLDCNVGLA